MSEIRVNRILDEQGTGAVELTQGASIPDGKLISGPGGINLTGIISASSYYGDGSNLTGVSGGSTVADDTSTDATFYPIFTQTTSGTISETKVSTTNLSFNPLTGNLSAVDFNSTSDENLKENIQIIENPIDFEIMKNFIDVYKSEIDYIELLADDLVISINGIKFFYAQGKIIKDEYYQDRNNYSKILYYYPDDVKPISEYRFRNRNKSSSVFFSIIYGKDDDEVYNNLEDINIFGRLRPINRKNSCSYNLSLVVKELEEKSKK